ncbi:MAG: hypothetical protein GWO02_00930, partial [Gammaproteobacteria bacterium]|nr:hypothetical protein [Gammaproteobacteria bacterium]
MSAFEHLLHECKDPVGAAVKLLLVWLAVADESLSRHERLLLAEAFDDTATGSGTFDQLRRIVEQGEVEDLLAASATVRDRLQPAAKEALLELAFRLANSDGGLSAAENHILQFLGD